MHKGWRRVRLGIAIAVSICALGAMPALAHAADRIKPKISAVTNTTIHPAGVAKKISATVKDNKKVKTVVLRYRVMPGKTFKSVTMKLSAGKYSATIPSAKLGGQPVQYYIQATDSSRNSAKAPTKAPGSLYKVTPCTKITVTPARLLFDNGQIQQYQAKATTKTGSTLTLKPVWSATAGIGKVTSGGLFTGNATNNGYIYAKLGGLTGSARSFARINGELTANTVWSEANGPYLVDILTIPVGRTLTIQPGAVVKFLTSSSYLRVYGTLNAGGTAAANVTFTSVKDDTAGGDTNLDGSAAAPAAADWDEVVVQSGGHANLNWTNVRYGGSSWMGSFYGAVQAMNGGHLSVKNSTISANKFGLHADNAATLEVSTTSFAGNTSGAAWINNPPEGTVLSGNTFVGTAAAPGKYAGVHIEGDVKGNLALPAEGVYTIPALDIPVGTSVTFGPGAIVKFLTVDSRISVYGTLNAIGAAASGSTPVKTCVFTGIKDDSVGGDTAGDGSATSPAAGNWETIYLGSGGAATMRYALVRYGAKSGIHTASEAYYGAIDCSSDSAFTAQYCDFVDNKVAVSGVNIPSPTTTYMEVPNLDVRDCYWGSTSGPSFAGHAGGDWVGFYLYDYNGDSFDETIVNEWVSPWSPTSFR